MHLLIIGGTVFLGRALVEAARGRGHRLTLFNRGKSNPDLWPEVETLHGDRDGGLAVLDGRRWDAVIDTCGYFPRVVGDSARRLAGAVDHYTFISSLSVYADTSIVGLDETGAVGVLADESVEEITGETYGPLKALCERAVEEALPGRTLVIRPGLIVGPHDPSDRFTYWPCRLARGGEALAPGRPERPIRFIDVRDLAAWTVALVERRQSGVFNADGPAGEPTMGDLLAACEAAAGSRGARLMWAEEQFLAEHEVKPWTELPLWIPESEPSMAGFFRMSNRRAVAAGLDFRPIADTVQATLAWASTRPPDHRWRAGMAPEREAELVAAWHRRQG